MRKRGKSFVGPTLLVSLDLRNRSSRHFNAFGQLFLLELSKLPPFPNEVPGLPFQSVDDFACHLPIVGLFRSAIHASRLNISS